MQLRILGSSPAVPNRGGASSGYLLESGGYKVLLECGHGVSGKLTEFTDVEDVSAIVISHMHPDHFFDLVPLKYAYFFGKIPKVPLFLPPGGQALLHRLQSAIRLADDFFEESFEVHEYDPKSPLELDGFRFDFGLTQHFVDAYAMRITPSSKKGGALAYSSDTAWEDDLLALFRGSTVGLFEATLVEEVNDTDASGHLTGTQAGELARKSGIQKLLMTHYWRENAQELCDEAAAAFEGPVDLAKEGERYDI
jgi:ribonuclease BN (tRNA processing enzyme)